jgi:predicted flap endonuclease-1-like 5' DNA nuclease
MGRFSWDAEEVSNITKILAGLGRKVKNGWLKQIASGFMIPLLHPLP